MKNAGGRSILSTLVAGRVAELVIVTMSFIMVILAVCMAKKKMPTVRRLAAMEALSEIVGRATETGRPIHMSLGVGEGGLTDAVSGPQLLGGLSVMSNLAGIAAQYRVPIIATVANADMQAIIHETLLQNYASAGVPELGSIDNVRYLSSDLMGLIAGQVGVMQNVRPAANIMVGPYQSGEIIILAETGFRLGAIQVAGVARLAPLPYILALCDYTLIGEEVMAAGAAVSKDPIYSGSLMGQDFLKGIMITLVILGVTLASMGSQWLRNLLNM